MSATPTPEYDQTLQVTAAGRSLDGHAPAPAHSPPHVAIVAGDQPGLSSQVYDLLRERLRMASLLIAFGFLIFFIKNLFYLGQFQTTAQWLLFWVHLGVLVLEATFGIRLCGRCPHILKHLRFSELLIFGAPAAFFTLVNWEVLHEGARLGYVVPITPGWVLLIFVYALFVPNRWRRAAVVISTFAAIPVALLLTAHQTSPAFADAIADKARLGSALVEASLTMLVAATAGIWGVYTIGRLREEAYEGRQIGQYHLKRLLGSGGMGEVYLAEHLLLKRPCAIKLIRPEKAGDPQALARFEREVQETARLTHWNSVEIFDYGRAEDGSFYYVMEYLPGMNLEQLVQMHGPLPPERVVFLLQQVCDALGEAHHLGMVHRDIKPANIFAAKRGGLYDVAKLLDFGLVKPSATTSNGQGSALTRDGMVAGSPLYMSPEQATGDKTDERSDIYSLGLVAYYLLTGHPPFEDEKPIKVMLAHVHNLPEPPSRRRPEVPHDLDEVVMRCLEKDPELRFPNVEALREALEDCECAGRWSREQAACWWEHHGCPHKKQLDQEVFAGAVA